MSINVPAGRYTACVIHDGGMDDQAVIFSGPNGTHTQYTSIPAGMLAQPGDLFDRVSKMFGERQGTLVVSRVPLNLDHPHDERVHVAAMIAAAHGHGWHVSSTMTAAVAAAGDGGKPAVDPSIGDAPDPLSGWFTFRHDAGHILHVGVRPMLDQGKTPLFDVLSDSPSRIARMLARYHELVGAPWRATAGVSGCAAVRTRWEQYARTPIAKARMRTGEHAQPLWQSPMPDGVPGAHGDITWKRPPIDGEAELPLHIFDINTMYLAAMQTAGLPYGELTHVRAVPCGAGHDVVERCDGCPPGIGFDRNMAGMWRVMSKHIDPLFCTGEILPPLVSMRMVEPDGSMWLTTPLLAEMQKRTAFGHDGFRVMEAVCSTETRPWLRGIAEDWRNALYRAHPAIPHGPACTGEQCGPSCMVWALGSTYKQTTGMIAKDGGSIHNPLARAMVVDTARFTMWLKVWSFWMLTGLAPIYVKTDEIGVHAAQNSMWVGDKLGVERKPGKFRYVKTLMPQEVTA